jgi:hypothetical protein
MRVCEFGLNATTTSLCTYILTHAHAHTYLHIHMHAYTGLYSFDNVFISLLTIYQAMTLAGWSEVMYNVQVRVVNVVSVVQCSAVK